MENLKASFFNALQGLEILQVKEDGGPCTGVRYARDEYLGGVYTSPTYCRDAAGKTVDCAATCLLLDELYKNTVTCCIGVLLAILCMWLLCWFVSTRSTRRATKVHRTAAEFLRLPERQVEIPSCESDSESVNTNTELDITDDSFSDISDEEIFLSEVTVSNVTLTATEEKDGEKAEDKVEGDSEAEKEGESIAEEEAVKASQITVTTTLTEERDREIKEDKAEDTDGEKAEEKAEGDSEAEKETESTAKDLSASHTSETATEVTDKEIKEDKAEETDGEKAEDKAEEDSEAEKETESTAKDLTEFHISETATEDTDKEIKEDKAEETDGEKAEEKAEGESEAEKEIESTTKGTVVLHETPVEHASEPNESGSTNQLLQKSSTQREIRELTEGIVAKAMAQLVTDQAYLNTAADAKPSRNNMSEEIRQLTKGMVAGSIEKLSLEQGSAAVIEDKGTTEATEAVSSEQMHLIKIDKDTAEEFISTIEERMTADLQPIDMTLERVQPDVATLKMIDLLSRERDITKGCHPELFFEHSSLNVLHEPIPPDIDMKLEEFKVSECQGAAGVVRNPEHTSDPPCNNEDRGESTNQMIGIGARRKTPLRQRHRKSRKNRRK